MALKGETKQLRMAILVKLEQMKSDQCHNSQEDCETVIFLGGKENTPLLSSGIHCSLQERTETFILNLVSYKVQFIHLPTSWDEAPP